MTHLRRSEWRVRDGLSWEVRLLIQTEHYSKDYGGGAVYRHVLVPTGDNWGSRIAGAAVWHPAVYGIRRFGCLPLQLSRLVVRSDMPTNAASFLLGRSMQLVERSRWPVLLTYADEGQGHTGAIYRATNWTLDGIGGGWCYYDPQTGQQLASLQDGHFVPCPSGWERRKTRKLRFVQAVAASSDAAGIQPDESGPQPTLPLHFTLGLA